MSTPVEQIKERLGIADVVGSYLKLERAGSSYKAKCPFHNEKTPSFFVSPARNSFYCFGCQKGGDLFTFVQEFEGLDFVGALRVLAQRAGVTLQRVDPKVRSQYARLYLLLEKAARFFEVELAKSDETKRYLESRGLKPETISSWRLGFAPHEWRVLFDCLLKEGFSPDEMEKVGLVRCTVHQEMYSTSKRKTDTPKQADRFYDTFRGRVMFPIQDSASRVIAFSGRILPQFDDGKTGKYINSPETVLFKKSEVLHGFHLAKLAIRQKDAGLLVEGQMDLLMAHQAGFANTVASSGTALTLSQLERLKRLSENLLIAFDSDSAGLKASERAIHLALSLGMNVRIIPLKDLPAAPGTAQAGKDPADLIAKDPEAWNLAVASAVHVIDFVLGEILSSSVPEREKALAIEKKLLPLLRRLPSRVEQSHFLKQIADRSGLREDALWETLKKISVPSGSQTSRESLTLTVLASHASNMVERRVFGILFLKEGASAGDADSFRKCLLGIFGEAEFAKRLSARGAERDALLAEAELRYGTGALPHNEEAELLRNLEEETVSATLARAMDALSSAERSGTKDTLPALLARCKELSDRLSTLKSARFSPTV